MVGALLMRRLAAMAALAAVVAAAPVAGHETWLAPSSFEAAPGNEIGYGLTSAMTFPAPGEPIAAQRVAAAQVRIAGATEALRPLPPGKGEARFAYRTQATGLAVAWVSLHPRSIRLSDAQVEEYLDEIGADAALRARWKAQRGRAVWQEQYAKHAKTFVAFGPLPAVNDAHVPVGQTYELVPLDAWRPVRPGTSLAVRVLFRGKPLAGAVVGLMQAGSLQRTFVTADVEGIVRIVPARTGRSLLFSVFLRPAADGTSWESDFSTLVFAVQTDDGKR